MAAYWHTSAIDFFLETSFCVHDFSEMVYATPKNQKFLFSILIEVTEYVAVLKNIYFLQNDSYV